MAESVGTRALVRLDLRLDRLRLGLLIGGLAAFVAMVCSSFDSLYPEAADRQSFAADMSASGAIRAFYGTVYGTSIGALTAWRSSGMTAIAALVAMFLVVRHTRGDEESGRRELLGATVVGRQAPLVATLVVALAAYVVLAAAITLVLLALGQPFAGSLALGLAFAGMGWVFAGVAAVAAQLTVSSRTANGIAAAVLAVAALLRMGGNAADANGGSAPWPVWLSPMGWADQVRPFAGNHWWVLILFVVATAVLVAAALVLSTRRDVGGGLLPTRPGPAAGASWLRSPVALAWRLQWGSLLAWAVGLGVFGAVIGGVAKSAADVVRDNPDLADMIERLGGKGVISDAFLAGSIGFLGVAAAGCGIQAALRLRGEETSERAEPVLATSVPRLRWAGSHFVFAFVGPAVAMLVAGVAAGVAYGLSLGDGLDQVGRVLAGALVQLPAVWVMAGVAILLIGAFPRWSSASWLALIAVIVILFVADLIDGAQWLKDLSPFTHIPKVPGGSVQALPLVLLTTVAAALSTTGIEALRRRDLG